MRPITYLSLFIILFAFILQRNSHVLLPHGPAVTIPKSLWLTMFGSVDYSNESLLHANLSKIYEKSSNGKEPPLLNGPETPIINPINGNIYALTEDGNLIRIHDIEQSASASAPSSSSFSQRKTARTDLTVNVGVGRPLGGKFTNDGKTVYIADAVLGLLRVTNVENEDLQTKVEIVASTVLNEDGTESRLRYANDVDIGPVTGHVYFTDSTDISPERLETKVWDTMTGYKRDCSRGKRTGRILRYNPMTDKVDILATGIWFANGIAVIDEDESSLMISETSMARVLKYHLKGPKEGTLEVLVEKLPGYPDGAACSFEMGRCFAPLPSVVLPLFVKISNYPEILNRWIRTLILMLPAKVFKMIKPVRYGGVVEIPIGGGGSTNGQFKVLQDPYGKEIGMLTGVATYKNELFMGSLTNKFIGVVEFEE